ncbi:malonate--CoA ligase ACSF3, mitochondrial-like [Bacillus rossius redtenbacheri]|uniref:malonate--CoA ligase ACSF3, mitochondrial-like n=1 Tax=Bacillus rossius redtenbacheri TaxID=93214 RepID=UPI002FDE4DB6
MSLLTGRLVVVTGSRQWPVLSGCWKHAHTATAPSPSKQSRDQPVEPVIPIFRYAPRHCDRIALRDRHGDYTYRGVFLSSRQLAAEISSLLGGRRNERVAFLCPNDASYLIAQWACWMSGQIAVPMCHGHPPPLLEHYASDCGAGLVITTQELSPSLDKVASRAGSRLLVLDDALRVLAMKPPAPLSRLAQLDEDPGAAREEVLEAGQEPEFYSDAAAMIVYTAGTTGMPKGVVLTHSNIQAQVMSLIQAWEWTHKDIVLHALPLHHVHGVVNVLTCPLVVGARCVMLPRFESSQVWSQLLAINMLASERVNMFMAVPTMYAKLIEEYDKIFAKNARMQEYIKSVCSQKIRLMVSGSSPLPAPVFEKWAIITGHRLLERYGLTETGMVLSNPLRGERQPGFVGVPLPGVEVQVVHPRPGPAPQVLVRGGSGGSSVQCADHPSGELQVKGPGVFRGYWNKPQATKEQFTADGWFKTGDTAQYSNGAYKILGRTNVDIIKTGGYSVSALEVETHLLGHPDIRECAVVGLPDITWGQKVAAVVVAEEGREVILSKLREWSKARMAPYCVPTVLKVVDKLPKNTMGKVNKKDLVKQLFPEIPAP